MEMNVLNFRLCPSFWKMRPPSNTHDVYVISFSSNMQIGQFNVKNIPGTHTVNVKSTIPLNFVSALQAKRITQHTFKIQVCITHHCISHYHIMELSLLMLLLQKNTTYKLFFFKLSCNKLVI